jgi:hypothetical protein
MVTHNPDLCYEPQSVVGHYYIEEFEFYKEQVGFLILSTTNLATTKVFDFDHD